MTWTIANKKALCSTPSGITASGTTSGNKPVVTAGVCSTPSGITASGTRKERHERTYPKMCSTPSGITASGTKSAMTPRNASVVLNAFRHHGERDQLLGLVPEDGKGAQRLPASRRAGRAGTTTKRTARRRAQRLPASRRAGPRWPGTCRATRGRAQRLPASRRAGPARARTPLPSTGKRAQRLPASRRAGLDAGSTAEDLAERCSTPSGITASGTSPSGSPKSTTRSAQRLPASRRAGPGGSLAGGECVRVLNAFRHHGERDQLYGSLDLEAECSTPSGITASGTWGGHARTSGGFTPVLNAFRHHGERDNPRTSPPWPATPCAQRLPASRRAGPPRPARRRAHYRAQRLPASRRAGHVESTAELEKGVCSTPSGIAASGTESAPEHRVRGHVLNAFRHHGERDWRQYRHRSSVDSAQRLPASRRAGLCGLRGYRLKT